MQELTSFYSRLELVEQEMARIIPKGAKPREVYDLIHEFLARGGKRFRPMMCLCSARAVGGTDKDALSAAAAIELFHNFTLIHDDIEDNSQLRRGEPCLHVKYGLPIAINAGDGLFMMVWKAALRMKAEHTLEAQRVMLDAFTSVLEGQAIELAWHRENRWDISEQDYLTMIGGKTASLIGASCYSGALLGGGTAAQCKALETFGKKVGLAFQIQDDLLNITGTEEKYQKEIGGDIREGKRTLMVIYALPRLSAADASRLKKILGTEKTPQADIEWCIAKLKSVHADGYADRYANRLLDEAIAELKALPKTGAREELVQVAEYIRSRER